MRHSTRVHARLGVALIALVLALPTARAADAPARLKVKLPADAKLTIQGADTRQTGAERAFQSPTLSEGKVYTYKLRATWTEQGKPVTVDREVDVEAGEDVAVDLRQASGGSRVAASPAAGKMRHFFFTYETTVTGLEPGKTARVWLPVPPSNEDQEVSISKESFPAQVRLGAEPKYGNKMLFLEAKARDDGTIPMSITYEVKRKEVKMDAQSKVAADEAAKFLKADKMVPVGGKALALLEGKALPMDQLLLGKALYDAVDDHVKYSKEGSGWGRGDVEWVCDSRFGNCTDFHSLFISLARAKNMPAKFEMGFPIPEKRGQGDVAGYHCWAKFRPAGRGWIPVDISEADKFPSMKEYYFGNLTEDRVAFSTGRDLELTPKQDGEALNFFIYPYVEVDGKPYAADKVKRKFSFTDAK